eukprot:scaffold1031_cov461-Prasinococcus_capsulatus_cf.AAC.7
MDGRMDGRIGEMSRRCCCVAVVEVPAGALRPCCGHRSRPPRRGVSTRIVLALTRSAGPGGHVGCPLACVHARDCAPPRWACRGRVAPCMQRTRTRPSRGLTHRAPA